MGGLRTGKGERYYALEGSDVIRDVPLKLDRSHERAVSDFPPADKPLRRNRPPPGDTLEREADIRGAAGLECGVHEKLLEHVLLRVAAAELVHASEGRTHQGDGFGVASCRVCELRLGNRQDVVAHDRWSGAAAIGVRVPARPPTTDLTIFIRDVSLKLD